ncbi:hypothetical protein N9K77_01640 [bacterium]|nr:hypothetical protein [bacterium]
MDLPMFLTILIPGVVSLDIGGYNHLLGTSYNELASLSRSMHKTQGFGSTRTIYHKINGMYKYNPHFEDEKFS